MKALSVVQPWAWLILHGDQVVPGRRKDVENRSWNTRYRGRLLIHASARATLDLVYDACLFVQRAFGADAACRMPHLKSGTYELGGIIGAVTLVDVLPPTSSPTSPWHMPGHYGWVLTDPESLPFLPCKGALGLWGSFDVRDGRAVRLGKGAAA